MNPIRLVTRPGSCRLYVCGLRVHHGGVGALIAAAGLIALRPALIAVGAVAALHDRRDFPWPLLDP